ncbi:MAG: hypothetical protein ACRC5A_17315 [Enterobacteriaceae bacterium]
MLTAVRSVTLFFSLLLLFCGFNSAIAAQLLPIWGDEARALGYDLPEPYGINFNYMNIHQDVQVNSITFNGLGWPGYIVPSSLFNIDVGHTRQHSDTQTIKLDFWLFPFMNLYGLTGKSRGNTHSTVSVDSDPSRFHDSMSNMLATIVHTMNQNGQLRDLDFDLKFDGSTFGGGTVLAGGYKNWFALTDLNFTRTHFSIIDGNIDAFTLSPRIGYRFTTPALPFFNLGNGKLSLWTGSMYQNIQQEFRGKLSDLSMPAGLQQLMQIANMNGNAEFDVKQHLQSPWNMLIGGQYALTPHFNITSEIGFSQRNSFFISAEYRF